MMQTRQLPMRSMIVLGLATIALAAGSGTAQVVRVWSGVAPGSERWTQKETTIENTPVGTVVLNVATLLPGGVRDADVVQRMAERELT